MHIIALAWLYVTLLMACTEPTVGAGILTFSLYGAAPLAILVWIAGAPARRRRSALLAQVADEVVRQPDRGHTRADQ